MNKDNNNQLSSTNIAYQQDVLDKFNERIKEIELFFDLIAKFEAVNPAQLIAVDDNIELITENDLLISTDNNVEMTVRNILSKLNIISPNIDLINIFKSNSVLLLYNLVESTVSNTDKFILQTITNANLLYSQATPKIKIFWIQHISKFNKNQYLDIAISLLDNIQRLQINIEKQVNDNEKEFQGNLDPKTVDELLDNYGIEVTKTQMMQQETERRAVKNIATWRSDLAHGKYSFAEFGRNKLRYNTSGNRDRENDILFLKSSCLLFLEFFLLNVETYIEQELYKQ